jgi:hypothetical protein
LQPSLEEIEHVDDLLPSPSDEDKWIRELQEDSVKKFYYEPRHLYYGSQRFAALRDGTFAND